MYKVSVVTPVYKAEKYIEKCARCLFEQTLEEIEYIFVNDCSPDNSIDVLLKVLEDYPDRKPHVKIIHHEHNTGQSGARKDGMALASGDFIIHCDADDWTDPDMYRTMYEKAIEDNVEAVCCDIVLECENASVVLRVNNRYEDHQLLYDCLVPISVEYLSLCNRLISRKVFERHVVEPFEGVNMWDDVGMSIRLRYYIRSTSVINQPFYHYNRLNEVSTTRRPLLERMQEQGKCIELIEQFFKNENAQEQYRHFISYLKIHSIEYIFPTDADTWAKAFKSERSTLWKIRHLYRKHMRFRYFVVGYGGFIGKLIWKLFWKK